MHRFSILTCLVLFLASVAGCETDDDGASNDPGSDSGAAKKVIGYSMLTSGNPFFLVIADSMKEEAAKHGYEVVVVSGDRDVKKQADQIDDFIVKGVSAIVLNPCDSKSIGAAIKRANEKGIPVFTNDLAYDGDDPDVQVASHVATDNLQGGHLAGQAMVKLLKETGGKVAILHFPQAESCKLRVEGFLAELDVHNNEEGSPKIEIVATLDGGGVKDEGETAARDALGANQDLAAIFAINDPSALGARAYLESVGKEDQVRIIGFDGADAGKKAILDGKIVCDPIQFPDQMGVKTVQMIVNYFNGDEVEKEILIPSKLYYQEDAQQDPLFKE
jgi:ribose transport system substrate-binding protein